MSAPVRRQTKLAAIGTVLALGAFAFYVHQRLDVAGPPLDNVPRGSSAVLYVNVPAVRGSSLWRHWVIDGGRDRGLQRLQRECGFDPLSSVDDLTAFVIGTEGRSLDHVGFLARGDLQHESLVQCMTKVVRGEGGEVTQLEIDGVPAVAGGRGTSRVAFLGSRGLAWGSHETVERIIKTVRGGLRGSGDDETLARPFDEARGADVIAIGRVPSHWRDALSRRLAASEEELSRTLASMERVALSVHLRDRFALNLAVNFGEEDGARRFAAALRARRDSMLRQPAIGLTVAARALRELEVSSADREARVAISLSSETARELLDLLSSFSATPATTPASAQATPEEDAEPSPREPDAVIRRDPPAP